MIKNILSYIEYIFFSFFCNKDKDSDKIKIKKSNSEINLLKDYNGFNINHFIELKIGNQIIKNYFCTTCKKYINNTNYLVYDKHFCSYECRENFLKILKL